MVEAFGEFGAFGAPDPSPPLSNKWVNRRHFGILLDSPRPVGSRHGWAPSTWIGVSTHTKKELALRQKDVL